MPIPGGISLFARGYRGRSDRRARDRMDALNAKVTGPATHHGLCDRPKGAQPILLSHWQDHRCVAEGRNGRSLDDDVVLECARVNGYCNRAARARRQPRQVMLRTRRAPHSGTSLAIPAIRRHHPFPSEYCPGRRARVACCAAAAPGCCARTLRPSVVRENTTSDSRASRATSMPCCRAIQCRPLARRSCSHP